MVCKRSVSVDGASFVGLREAGRALGMSASCVLAHIRRGRPGWFYHDQGQLAAAPNLRRRPVLADGTTYYSLRQAARSHGIPVSTALQMIRGGVWRYADGGPARGMRHRACPVSVDGVAYRSLCVAGRALGISASAVRLRAANRWDGYRMLDGQP